jgi:hypothetical protein
VGSIIRRYSPFPNFLKVQDDLLLEEIHMDSTGPPAAPTALYTNIASLAAKPPSSTPSRPPNGGNGSASGNRTKYHNKNRNSGHGGGHNGNNSTGSRGNISTLHPLASSNPSSIVVGNVSSLPITSVGDSVLSGPFYLNNILLAPDLVQSLFSVHRFTIDNWCSIEFNPFGLSVKDLTTKNMIIRSNSTDPLYTMRLPGSLTPSFSAVAALTAVPHALTDVAPTMWHCRLDHPGSDALSSLSRSSFIQCTGKKHDFCHSCQLAKHTRLPFCSSSHRAEHPFDLIHLDLWTSPVVSVSGSKYYLIILDDFTHYLWTFPLKLKSDTFTTLSNFFAYVSTQFGRTLAYVSTQFGRTVKAIQCDNGREFDNSSTRIFLLSHGTQLRMSCPYTSPQNGKSERIIRSVNNVIRTLLI